MLIDAPGLSVLRVSSVYESPAWGYDSEHDYLNAVVEVNWQGPPLELANLCYRIEAAGGRHERGPVKPGGYRDRPIDLDLLWIEGITCETERLILPHPRAHLRSFVLVPWAELDESVVLNGSRIEDWLDFLPIEDVAELRKVDDVRLDDLLVKH